MRRAISPSTRIGDWQDRLDDGYPDGSGDYSPIIDIQADGFGEERLSHLHLDVDADDSAAFTFSNLYPGGGAAMDITPEAGFDGDGVEGLLSGAIVDLVSFPSHVGPSTGELCVAVEVNAGSGPAPPFFTTVYPTIVIRNGVTQAPLATLEWPNTAIAQFQSRTFTLGTGAIAEPDPWVFLMAEVYTEPGSGTVASWGAFPTSC